MRQALEAVLFPRGLDYDVQGTLVAVFPRKASTRLFTVNYLNVRRTWRRDLGNGRPGWLAGLRTSVMSNIDRFDELTKACRRCLSASGRLHVDRGAALVQVTDFADRLDLVGVYVEAVQMRAMRQVRIDAQVLQVGLGEGTASIDWSEWRSEQGRGRGRLADSRRRSYRGRCESLEEGHRGTRSGDDQLDTAGRRDEQRTGAGAGRSIRSTPTSSPSNWSSSPASSSSSTPTTRWRRWYRCSRPRKPPRRWASSARPRSSRATPRR